MKKRFATALIATLIILLPDLWTKQLVVDNMALGESRPVIDGFFNLVYVLNRGSAFGFLNTDTIDWQVWLFIGVTIIALGVIVVLLAKARDEESFLIWGLGLIAGGALGNLVDRINLGQVVDFLDFYIGSFHWPAFNIADCGISVGALFVILSMLRNPPHAPDSV